MFYLNPKEGAEVRLKGWFQKPIEFERRVTTGDWSAFFGKYQNQRWGIFDSDSCWALSAINCVEDQLEWLWKSNVFSQEAMAFFMGHGYIDIDGDFSLSERFLEVQGGRKQDGGTSPLAWQLMQQYGVIPRKMLTYTVEQVQQFPNQETVAVDYFNPKYVTPEMLALGELSKKYINIAYQIIGKNWQTPYVGILKQALQQAPLCIGIPIPTNAFDWNNTYIKYGGQRIPVHEVELYDIDDKGNYLIFDQYEPHLKTLSSDYYLPLVTQGIVYALNPAAVNPIPQPPKQELGFWSAVFQFFNNIKNSIPVGKW